MASGLKSRLAHMAVQSGVPVKVADPVPRTGIYVDVGTSKADERLYALDKRALRRMGFAADWPGIERALFLDTETTGLSRGAGTVAFLIGLGSVKDGVFSVEQRMLGDYPDEPELIDWLARRASDCDTLITFNGNAFDLPLLESRAVMCRAGALFARQGRLDLMHPSRRLWRRRLGSCSLSALERQVLCVGREGDLPGSEAPARFFHYLQTGERALLDDVLRHNRQDILSLGSLLIRLCEAYAHPVGQTEIADLFSMGRTMERGGEREIAEQCYGLASSPRPRQSMEALRGHRFAAEASLRLALLKKRAGDDASAETVWLAMARRGQMGAVPYVELAKLYEHKTRDFSRALEFAKGAMARQKDPPGCALVQKRMDRLERKMVAGLLAKEDD